MTNYNSYRNEISKFSKMGREDFLKNGGKEEDLKEIIISSSLSVDAGWAARVEEQKRKKAEKNAAKKARKLAKSQSI